MRKSNLFLVILFIIYIIANLWHKTNIRINKYQVAPQQASAETKINESFGAKTYQLVDYKPLTKAQCMEKKTQLGLQFCPYDNDHLAGAALACGHINNLPSGNDLHQLAQKVYHKTTDKTSIYGERDDKMLRQLGIFINDSHLFYWTNEEAKDGTGTYIRMFASRGSIPYYAPRDGKGYVSQSLGGIKYGETKYIRTKNPAHDSNLAGLPNNDVLATICFK